MTTAGNEGARELTGAASTTGSLGDELRVRLESILKEILVAKDLEFHAQRPLRDQGFDSADTLTLLSEIESQFNVMLDDADVGESNFLDTQSVVALLIRKVGDASQNRQ